jgi:tetratricopeptide (TPR) repeat protein
MTLFRVTPMLVLAGVLLLSGCHRDTSRDQDAANRMLRNALQLADAGRISAARDSAARAAELFQNTENEDGLGEAHRLLGELEGSEAAFGNAFAHYGAAIQHFTTAGDKVGVLSAELAMMDLSVRMGREDEAYVRGEDLLRLANVTHDTERARIVSGALLPIARTLGKNDEVATLLKTQMHLADSTADLKRSAWLMDQRGITELAAGSAPLSAATFLEARTTADRARDTALDLAIAIHLGQAYIRMGNIPDAISTLADAVGRTDSLGSGGHLRQELLLRLGNVLLRARRFTEAIRTFQSALTASHETGNALARRYALLQLGNALRQSDPASALPIARQALTGLDENAPPSLAAFAYGTAGLCELAANQPVDAVTSLQSAVAATEREWRHPTDDVFADCEEAVVGAGRTPWHDELTDLLLRMGKNQEALTTALRRSAWNLFRDLDRITPAVEDQTLGALLGRWHAERASCNGAEDLLLRSWISLAGARERAASVAATYARSRADAKALASEIASVRKPMECFVSPSAPSATDLQQALPEGAQLLLYGTTSRTLQIFVVNKEEITAHSVSIARSQVAARCTAFLDALGGQAVEIDSLTDYQPRQLSRALLDRAGELYELFLRPVERDLGSARSVLIAQSADLPFLPLGGLRRNGIAGTSLIERFPVTYVLPSTLTGVPVPGGPVKDLLAFGATGFSGRDGEYEVRDIKASFNDARFYFGPGVSLATLSSQHADLAHLVLDVRWDEERPSNSCVWMSDPQSGVIKGVPIGDFVRIPAFPAVEIHNLARDCSAAAARLPVIPFAAGSRLVILNCAGTGRKSTKGFVEALSTELASGKGVAAAYRSAMLDIVKRPDAVPPFWMPFILWSN